MRVLTGLLQILSLTEAISAIKANATNEIDPLFNRIFLSAYKTLSKNETLIFISLLLTGTDGAEREQIQYAAALEESDMLQALLHLGSLSLIESRSVGKGSQYAIHNLTRAFLEWLRKNDPAAESAFSQIASANLVFWKDKAIRVRGSDLVRSCETNLLLAVRYGLEYKDLLDKVINLVLAVRCRLGFSYSKASWIKVIRAILATKDNPASSEDMAALYFCVAGLEWQANAIPDAQQHFIRSRELCDHGGQTGLSTANEIGIALIDAELGNHKKAKKALRDIYSALTNNESSQDKARILIGLGAVYFISGNYATAENWFRRAIKGSDIKDKLVIAQLWVCRGLCHLNLSHYVQALKHFRFAQSVLGGEIRLQSEQLQIDLLRSAAFFQLGDTENAETALRRNRDLNKRIHSLENLAFLESSLGKIYLGVGRTKAAKVSLKKAARLWEKAGKPQFALDVNGLFTRITLAKDSD